jgi:bacteriocin-like protein
MSSLTSELSIDELEAVSGGMQNLKNLAGFRTDIKYPDGSSPLYGNGSFHDTIDLNDNLPN